MGLSDLPARELARIDAVCLDFENQLRRRGPTTPTAAVIEELVRRHGGEHGDVLRQELQAISDEIKGTVAVPGPAEPTLVLATTPEPGFPVPPIPSSNRGSTESNSNSPTGLPTGLPVVGTQIGPYLLTSILGQGGMGIVYRATDTRLDRSVAIKMLAVGAKHASTFAERFQREAKAVAALTHPNIVELFDVGVHETMPYAVMEHLRGETLMRRMDARRLSTEPIPIEMVRSWGLQLADALACAHAAGVIHRDLKPENVMLVGSGVASRPTGSSASEKIPLVKLFDFGLSRVGQTIAPELGITGEMPRTSAELESMMGSGSDSKTRAGMIMGTPGYMAPEQARGEMVTPAVDVFSLGCVLFEAFYGSPAFSGQTPAQRYASVLESNPQPHPMRRRDDPKMAELITWMLQKKPSDRPTASQVVAALRPDASASAMRQSDLANSAQASSFTRRRCIELIGGGLAGALIGATVLPGTSAELHDIRSIGVLSLKPASQSNSDSEVPIKPLPIGARALLRGELLAGLLVNELAKLDGISVPKYVPITVQQSAWELPDGYRRAAAMLEVDALVTGTYGPVSLSSTNLMDVQLQIISGKTGKLLDGWTVRVPGGDNLIEQTMLAREVAQRIGQRLQPTDERSADSSSGAFACLIKGRTYADPDSEAGLRMAIKCFEQAISEDPDYGQALGGLALTSITLAARTQAEETGVLIAQARQAAADSLRISPGNPEARLAEAMLAYQTLGSIEDYQSAEKTLAEVVRLSPNLYQAHHQYGWLKFIQLDETTGLRELRLAAQLHPSSLLLKTDLARAQWFRGYIDRAINEASILLKDSGAATELTVEDSIHPRGLLIDLYEQSSRFEEAAALDPSIPLTSPGDSLSSGTVRNDYFAARQSRLQAIPYGPFGPALNQAILDQRRTDTVSRDSGEKTLTALAAATPPMLALLLARHPAFASLAMLPAAAEIVPTLQT